MIQDGTVDITFLICTFHREDLLVEALHSMLRLDGLGEIRYEILVIDNSDEESAHSAIDDFVKSTACTQLRYLPAHPANISVARNVGVDAAKGAYIAMIDDDMKVYPGWLQAMRPLLREGTFDVLSGPVEAVFEDPALATGESRKFFHRAPSLTAGTELHVMGPRRTRNFVPATSNAVFRGQTCFADGTRFDLRYGKSGGEDLDLFCRLEQKGRRFTWVPNAWMSEIVPTRRCSFDYLERRSFSGGQIFAAIHVRNSPFPFLVAAKLGVVAALQLLVSHARSLVKPPRSEADEQSLGLRRAAIKGKLHWRQMFPLYARDKQGLQSGEG